MALNFISRGGPGSVGHEFLNAFGRQAGEVAEVEYGYVLVRLFAGDFFYLLQEPSARTLTQSRDAAYIFGVHDDSI
jgi:hypothetical protein